MKKEGARGSDQAFFKLLQFAGEAVLKLAGVTRGIPYEMRAETLKEKKVSPDIVAVPKAGAGEVVFMEFQGYSDSFIRYRLAGSVCQFCFQKRYSGPVIPVIFYTEKAFFEAAEPLKIADESGTFGIRGEFKEVVLETMSEEELIAVDPRLIVLAPFCTPKKTEKKELDKKARRWSETAMQAFGEKNFPEARDILALFLLNRFRNLSREEVIAMLDFDLAETQAGKDVFRMGELRAFRESVIENLQARFEIVPPSIVDNIYEIDDLTLLKTLVRKSATAESLVEFKGFMEKAISLYSS